MSLQAPKLDDRQFQDIVDEAKKRIPHYLEEWTDHNVSDPGVTLIELFAWMTDMMLYRMNRLPERHYIKFMEMLGIRLQEPVPAKVPVTFWLSAAQETAVVIPAGTEVATVQTETDPSIVFTTESEFIVRTPDLAAVLRYQPSLEGDSSGEAYQFLDLRRLENFEIFSSIPQAHDGIYFGFSHDLSHHILEFYFACSEQGGIGIDSTLPPYLWEAAAVHPERGVLWQACELEEDKTKGLLVDGRMQIHLPHMDQHSIGEATDLYWVRLRLRERDEYSKGMLAYSQSPRINDIAVITVGGTANVTHTQEVSEEILGISDGSAGQQYQLQVAPVLPLTAGQGLIVEYNDQHQLWAEVSDFADCDEHDQVFTLDHSSGELRLGPALRQPDGTVKLYGAIPPRNAVIKFSKYRHGGGQTGNVAAGKIRTLKTSIPFISRVHNRQPARGGRDEESLQNAIVRAPAVLRSRDRAVTERDFEFLAQQALRNQDDVQEQVGRVKCLQPRPSEAGRIAPGQVYVLVIPYILNPARYLAPSELEPSSAAIEVIRKELDQKRLLTTRLDIRRPEYRWVAVRVQCRPNPDADETRLRQAIEARLYKFLNPLTGGADGKGWPFGRELFESDVYQCLQGMPNVQFIRKVSVFVTTAGGGIQGNAVETVEIVGHGTIASGVHEVVFL
jgi:hypothetical protein